MEPRRAHRFRQDGQPLFDEGAGLGLGDDRQVLEAQIGQGSFRPLVGFAGIRVNGIGHELLTQAEHLQGVALDPLEGRIGPVDQEPFRWMADPQRRCGSEQL